jgi:hypothetical protein
MIPSEKNCQVASLFFFYHSPKVNDCELRQITSFHLLSWCSETRLRQLARPAPRNRNNIKNDIRPRYEACRFCQLGFAGDTCI